MKLLSLALIVLMSFFMFTSIAQAAYLIDRFPVFAGSGDQTWPDIDGDIVVWQDSDSNIHWAQIHGSPSSITGDGTQAYPAVSGNVVVWYDTHSYDPGSGSTTQRDIYGYNLLDGTDLLVTSNDDIKQWYPDISGNYIVYEHLAGVYNIYVYNIGTSASEVIPGASAHQLRPAIDGDLVVWGDGRADGYAGFDIYYCDLSSTPYTANPVSGSDGDQWNPAVSGTVVVWREDPDDGSGFNIYGYDLTDSGTGRFPISTASGNQDYPAVSGNIVVWEDQSDSNIWAIDLDDRAAGSFRVSDGSGTNKSPAISGKTIVWERSGDIYAAKLQDFSDVEVTGPNGGESFTAGSSMMITWTTDGAVPSVLIEFSSDGQTNWIPLATVSETNSYSWDPVDDVDSVDCWIRVTNTEYPNVTDTSDAAFEIHPIPDEITVLSPNGGDMFLADSEMEIRWTSIGDVNDVTILFSPDDEQTWQTVTPVTPNDGRYTWDAVPADANSVQCLVHISDVADSSTWDMSDNHFTVFQCKSSLTADVTGDCFVDMADVAELARQWLTCGNPYDPTWCSQ